MLGLGHMHEWENPSSVMLSGEETTQVSALGSRIFDPYAAGNYSEAATFVNPHETETRFAAAGHPLQYAIHNTQTQNAVTVSPNLYEAPASGYYAPPAYGFRALGHPFGPESGFTVEPKSEPVVGGLEFTTSELISAGASRIGLNLGRRTYFASTEDDLVSRLYRRSRLLETAGNSGNYPRCQAEGCNADLTQSKHYHRRHRVCEFHSKAAVVVAAGLSKRFCQQCSRFHPLSEFDNDKRSCRKRLADHNRRRRKSNSNNHENKSGQQYLHKDFHALMNSAHPSSENLIITDSDPIDSELQYSTCSHTTNVVMSPPKRYELEGIIDQATDDTLLGAKRPLLPPHHQHQIFHANSNGMDDL